MVRNAGCESYNMPRINATGNSVTSFTVTEVILYAIVIVNLMYSLLYPVYVVLHARYHYLMLAFMLLLCVSEIVVKISAGRLAAVVIFIAASIAVVFLNHSGLGLIVLLLCPLMVIYALKSFNLSPEYINRVGVIMLVGWITALVVTVSYNQQFIEGFALDLAVINPNTIAFVVVITSLFVELYLDNTNKLEIIKVIVYGLSILALYRARSRMAMLAYLAVIAVGIIGKKLIKQSMKTGMITAALVVVAGVFFPFVYTLIYSKGIVSPDAQIMGKRLFSGRQYIWLNLWEYLQAHKKSFLIGVGYNTQLYSEGTFNLHNAYLMVFAQYGILILFVYVWYILYSIHGMYDRRGLISDSQFKCYQILLFILMDGFGETVLSYLPNMLFMAMAIGIGHREKSEAMRK